MPGAAVGRAADHGLHAVAPGVHHGLHVVAAGDGLHRLDARGARRGSSSGAGVLDAFALGRLHGDEPFERRRAA